MATHIGERIRTIRLQQNITQAKLARGICSVAYLSKVENGIEQPTDEWLNKIEQRLSLSKYHFLKVHTPTHNQQLESIIQHYCETREFQPEYIPYLEDTLAIENSTYRLVLIYALLIDYYDYIQQFEKKKTIVHQAEIRVGTSVVKGFEYSYFIYLNMLCLYYGECYQFHRINAIIAELLAIPLGQFKSVFQIQFYIHVVHARDQAVRDFYQARLYMWKIIELERQLGRNMSNSYVQLISLHLKYNHFNSARQLLNEAEQKGYFNPDDYYVDYCYARVHESFGNFTEAIEYYVKAFSHSEKRRGHKRIILISRLLKLLMLQERIDEMNEWLTYGLSIMHEAPISNGHGGLYYYKAKLQLLMGNHYSYEEDMLEAIQFTYKHELMIDFQIATHELANYYYERRRYKQAAKIARWHMEHN